MHVDICYIHNPQHRDGNPNKTQWTINEIDERSCFQFAGRLKYEQNCELSTTCWGIHVTNGRVCALGKSAVKSSAPIYDLIIAKFVDGNANHKWHGYPADHEANIQDIPPECVRSSWLKSGYLTAAKIRKISRGQRCRL